MSNPITSSSDVWAQLVANIGPLLVLVGEKHVKAYFKTMHKTSHHLLFAASPIGLVTAVTTLIRLSDFLLLKRLIGRQFEPRAEVLLDVTSISCGEVGLELIGRSLEQSLNPTPDNLAIFWIRGEKRGTSDELARWIRGHEWSIIKHTKHIKEGDYPKACYSRSCGSATASAARAKGPGAVWLVREKALGLWEGGGGGKAAHDFLSGDNEMFMNRSHPSHSYIGDVTRRARDTMKLKEFCKEKRTKICPNNNTTCKATGVVIAHLTDISHVLTASENLDSRRVDALTYAVVLFSLCCNVGIVVAIGLTGGAPLTVGLVGGGLLVTGAGSWLTALSVDSASKERIFELSHFDGTAAGFVSRDNLEGVELARCPTRAIASARPRDYKRPRHFNKVVVPALLVFLMVGGFVALYLGLRSSPWWVSLSALGVAAVTSCARSMLDHQILLDGETRKSSGISYAIPWNWGWEWKLDFPGEHERSSGRLDSFPSDATDPDSFLVSDSYEVAVPTGFTWARDLQSLPWKIAEGNWDRVIILALHLAHEMRVKSIAPFEVERFSGDGINPAGLVFLHSDLLAADCVIRQPLEVLVAPAPAEDASRPGAILESILLAAHNLSCRARFLLCYPLGDIDTTHLSIELRKRRELVGVTLKEIDWQGNQQPLRLSYLSWAVAKIVYVIMLNVAEGAMLEMGRMLMYQRSTEGAPSEYGIRALLQSMQRLKLVVDRKPSDSAGSGGIYLSPSPSRPSSSSPSLNHPSSSHPPPSHPPPSNPPSSSFPPAGRH